MTSWIFQSVAEHFDLRSPNNLEPGSEVTWYATRYRDRMISGDVVYFWMGGDDSIRGIYGWGVLTSSPYRKRTWDSYGVDAKIEMRFKKPVLARALRSDRHLTNLSILRQPQASNFLLEPDEAKAIARIVKDSGEVAPVFDYAR